MTRGMRLCGTGGRFQVLGAWGPFCPRQLDEAPQFSVLRQLLLQTKSLNHNSCAFLRSANARDVLQGLGVEKQRSTDSPVTPGSRRLVEKNV